MKDPHYEEQRSEGAVKIIQVSEILSAEANIKIEKSEWDGGKPIAERENHSLYYR